jgi:hypothetical protein
MIGRGVPAQDRGPAYVVYQPGVLAVYDYPLALVFDQRRPADPGRENVDDTLQLHVHAFPWSCRRPVTVLRSDLCQMRW